MKFFSRRAVFDHCELVQSTVTMLLDRAATVARSNQGAFDFKKDFAFQFPIRDHLRNGRNPWRRHRESSAMDGRATRSMDPKWGVSATDRQTGPEIRCRTESVLCQIVERRASRQALE